MKSYWNNEKNEILLERSIDYLIDSKIGNKCKNDKKSTDKNKYKNNKKLVDYKIEVLFDSDEIFTKSNNLKNYVLFNSLKIEKLKKSLEVDSPLVQSNKSCAIQIEKYIIAI